MKPFAIISYSVEVSWNFQPHFFCLKLFEVFVSRYVDSVFCLMASGNIGSSERTVLLGALRGRSHLWLQFVKFLIKCWTFWNHCLIVFPFWGPLGGSYLSHPLLPSLVDPTFPPWEMLVVFFPVENQLNIRGPKFWNTKNRRLQVIDLFRFSEAEHSRPDLRLLPPRHLDMIKPWRFFGCR